MNRPLTELGRSLQALRRRILISGVQLIGWEDLDELRAVHRLTELSNEPPLPDPTDTS